MSRAAVRLVVLWCVALGSLPGCRSTSTNVTGPSSTRCAVTLSGTGLTVAGGGGTGSISVSVDRECSWTATSESPWIAITSGGSGQGPGTIAFSVAANPSATPRQGGIAVGAQRAIVQQEGAACTFAVSPASASLGSAGGSLRFSVATLSGCAWTAQTSVPWATIDTGGSGSGSGEVVVQVSPNAGAPRSATLTIAGVPVTVAQSGPSCSYSVSLSSSAFGPQGGSGTASVTTAAGCEWSATSNQPWLSIGGPPGGSGPGSVSFTVVANSGSERTAVLTVAGQPFTIGQAAAQSACAFSVSPGSRSVGGEGGTGTFGVTTAAGCEWAAASNATWLTITDGARGSGSGAVTFSAAFNSGGARTGTLSIAGETVTVAQAATTCTFQVAPATLSIPAAGGPSSVTITTAPACLWSAVSNVAWITLTSAAAGTGSGVASFTVSANDGGAREGSLTIAGQTVLVSQSGAACSYILSPSSLSVGAAGGSSNVNVTAPAGCTWTAASNDAWLTITSGTSGSGGGTVTLAVAGNTGPARTGTLTIAGQSFVVSQAAASVACTYGIAPTSQSTPAGGATVTVSVTAPAGCAWSATSNAPWVTIASGASGTGNGSVTLAVAANAGTSSRDGTVTIAGLTFTVSQAGVACTYSLSPASASFPAAGGSGSVDVGTTAGCTWTATSGAAWLRLTGGTSGTGGGRVSYDVAANADVQERTGTLTIAGQAFTVAQAGAPCIYAVSPQTVNAARAGENVILTVTSPSGCTWTAVSGVPWVTITAGASGAGNGTVGLSIAQNSGAARSGTLTVAGQTVTVNQQ